MDHVRDNISASDDIDLLLFLERLLRFWRRFRWIFVTAAVLGLAAGFLAYKNLGKIYSSKMVLHSFLLTNQELIEIAGNWNSLLSKGEYAALAKELACDESTLRPVKNISAEEIQKVFSPNNPHGFTISVRVTNNDVLEQLESGIVHGYENNEYVRRRLDAKRQRLDRLTVDTRLEIAKLDSTKKIIEGIIAGRKGTGSPIIIDGAAFNRQSVEMNEKLLSFQEELQFARAVQVLHGFSAFNRPTGPRLIPWLVIGLALFLCLAFTYVVYRTVSDKIRHRNHRLTM